MISSSSQSPQQAESIGSQIDASVAAAAFAVSALLTQDGKAHAVIGGQAVRLLGNRRLTYDVDILVDGPALAIRARLVEMDERFSIDARNKLVFRAGNHVSTDVELLQGGAGVQLALPSAAEAPKVVVDSVSILHPGVLIITKVKRWVHLAESTRPQSIAKAASDFSDIEFLLHWLVDHNQEVDFESYAAVKPKVQLLPMFRTLYRIKTGVRGLLQRVLKAADFEYITSQELPAGP
ncbi:MAG: hypothetical protein LQ338_004306 [Usnochroma carphineum]|nr:MAG: hypothetical protein LQ338_004306 [Usnochroma carphineum]